MQLHLHIIGVLLIVLAMIHVVFPRYFRWKQELAALSLINRQMVNVHTFFIAFVILLMGLLCLSSSSDLIQTALGKKISLGFDIFWIARLLVQFFGYSPQLWKGKTFETTVHVVFICLWTYLSFIFSVIALDGTGCDWLL